MHTSPGSLAGGLTSSCLRPRRWQRPCEPKPQRGEQQQATAPARSRRGRCSSAARRRRSIEEAQQAAQGVGQHAAIVRPGGLSRGTGVLRRVFTGLDGWCWID